MTMSMDMFGHLEDAPNERMVARVLGYRVGTADGWFHCGGHTVFMPEFEMEPGMFQFAPTDVNIPKHTGLMIDYYAGLIALVPHAAKGSSEPILAADMKPIWSGKLGHKS